ncbi:undecaprenyl-phosphate glucose phosphotransferase [Ferrovibrio sp.]|uniref:undecaprenyl-phosphate glucose phosphotransferase n=1 Tax=Ferrovibrio sp. TaxID=1917215 RepID=UPI000CB14CFA|nr:undecaprenyl-phosphate glucose phosphotransferase [Ferrovibrio sp.]PJI44454.1 MAG: undecaprenyl-phosphate glucose phosphotransferase [Ferrovibrio sp.]
MSFDIPTLSARSSAARIEQPRVEQPKSHLQAKAQVRAIPQPATWHGKNSTRDTVRDSARATRLARRIEAMTREPVSLPIVSGLLRAWDAAAILVAGLAALMLAAPDLPMTNSYYVALAFFGAVVAGNSLHIAGAYRIEKLRLSNIGWARPVVAWSAAAAVTAIAVLASGASLEENWTWLALWFILGLFLPLLARGALAIRMDYWRKAGRLRRRLAILGAGPGGQMLLRRFVGARREDDIAIVGLYDDRTGPLASGWRGHAVRGNCTDLMEDIRRGRIDMVVIASPPGNPCMDEMLAQLRCVAVDICFCPEDSYATKARSGVEIVGQVPLMMIDRRPLRDWSGVMKEVEDRVFAALIVLLISPLLAGIALAIKLDSPGPVLFRQKRYGRNNKLIEVLKFRSMYHHVRDPNGTQLATRNDPRVTRVGAFLRRTSLDELPQFFNVIRGDMSVVGPRPHALLCKAGGVLYQDAVENYDWRHRIKPGITGWAQINGWRGETETVEQIQKRVEHDIYYIENWSLLLDVKIIVKTIFGGFTGNKAY